MAASDISILPIATVQHDFPTVLSEIHSGAIPSESIWLSCYKHGETSVHGKIEAALDDHDRERVAFSPSDGVELERVSDYQYKVGCLSLGVDARETAFVVPTQTYADPIYSDFQRPHQIPTFALSRHFSTSDPPILATGHTDGAVSIYMLPSTKENARQTAYASPVSHAVSPYATGKLHKSTVTALHFIPGLESAPLLASAGIDFAIHITLLPTSAHASALSSPLRLSSSTELKGHTRAITALLPLTSSDPFYTPELAPTLLSASTDGTLRLWDVHVGKQTAMWGTSGWKGANALATGANAPGGASHSLALVYAALSTGGVEAFDVRARTSAARAEVQGSTSAATAIAVQGGAMAVGSSDGVVRLWDLRALDAPRAVWKRGGAGVSGVAFLDNNEDGEEAVVVSSEDGLPYAAAVRDREVRVRAELVFGDVEAVRCVRVEGDEVWMSGDGGVVRKYVL
ncbi:hypothetical protein HETIRDRAFT_455811 [Heterobasidion irregulare TC 32-1]|uniref:WD40 repeat-like protein n=1 Tax=Heterobasidion irregulare (strain TC 32-1) TaxID=747525 RepID=W4JNK4_HETIT|nr:uncharacterized protein HETIRDRAFT_455811 [Heterobasidion irregulare TC 32-1]ETW75123.1 hypothetical protein HETIRDRAFT_455811 [Heterobasidion irregulare TC 32-1]